MYPYISPITPLKGPDVIISSLTPVPRTGSSLECMQRILACAAWLDPQHGHQSAQACWVARAKGLGFRLRLGSCPKALIQLHMLAFIQGMRVSTCTGFSNLAQESDRLHAIQSQGSCALTSLSSRLANPERGYPQRVLLARDGGYAGEVHTLPMTMMPNFDFRNGSAQYKL